MASGGGPMNVTPRSAHSSANAGSSATNPQPTQAASAAGLLQRPRQLGVIQIGAGTEFALVPQHDRLVRQPHEQRAALRPGVQRDDLDPVAELGVQLANGPRSAGPPAHPG